MAVIEGQIAGGELLISKESSVFATIECQVSHEATGSVVHENSLLSIRGSSIGSHVEDNVLERSGLQNLVVSICSTKKKKKQRI